MIDVVAPDTLDYVGSTKLRPLGEEYEQNGIKYEYGIQEYGCAVTVRSGEPAVKTVTHEWTTDYSDVSGKPGYLSYGGIAMGDFSQTTTQYGWFAVEGAVSVIQNSTTGAEAAGDILYFKEDRKLSSLSQSSATIPGFYDDHLRVATNLEKWSTTTSTSKRKVRLEK